MRCRASSRWRSAAAACAPVIGAEHRLHGLLDLRAIAGFDGVSWLDAGFDRARFGSDDEAVVPGAVLLEYQGRWLPTSRHA